jgi:hypothetical protein
MGGMVFGTIDTNHFGLKSLGSAKGDIYIAVIDSLKDNPTILGRASPIAADISRFGSLVSFLPKPICLSRSYRKYQYDILLR